MMNYKKGQNMELTVIEKRDLCCAFTETDINKYFGMGFEQFCKKRDCVEKFADIIIDKAIKLGKYEKCSEENLFEISLYEAKNGKFLIYLEREK